MKMERSKMKKPKKKVATVPAKNVKQPSARASLGPPNYDLMKTGDLEHASQLHALLLSYFRNVALLAKGKSSLFTKESVIDCTVLPDGGVASTLVVKKREVILKKIHSLVLAAQKKFQERSSAICSYCTQLKTNFNPYCTHLIAELSTIWVGCKSVHNRSYLVFLLTIQKIVKDSASVGAFSYSDARHFADEYKFKRITNALTTFKDLATEAKHRELWGCYVEWEVLNNFVNKCVQ